MVLDEDGPVQCGPWELHGGRGCESPPRVRRERLPRPTLPRKRVAAVCVKEFSELWASTRSGEFGENGGCARLQEEGKAKEKAYST